MDHPATTQTYPGGDYWSAHSVRSAISSRSRASTWDAVFSLETVQHQHHHQHHHHHAQHDMHHTAAADKDEKPSAVAISTPMDWCRGQAADVVWSTVDPTFQASVLRLEVCNQAWDVPTTIAEHAPADAGRFEWKRVHWGMPIQGGYFIKAYAVSELGMLELVGESPLFSIVQ